jgi:hypothetical protein
VSKVANQVAATFRSLRVGSRKQRVAAISLGQTDTVRARPAYLERIGCGSQHLILRELEVFAAANRSVSDKVIAMDLANAPSTVGGTASRA